mmetsp:Transcript_21735/g.51003  ORF Transcript_21735/g.51003 Transcript_21735/m.51003 type:complete len:263 (+) Transcript_21735:311-1099(+)
MFGRRRASQPTHSDTKQNGRKPVTMRTRSMPPSKTQKAARQNSILRYVSADDSMHSKYGESKRSEERRDVRMKFKNIEIREYERTIGDNPSCSSGPPISIGWKYVPAKVLPLDVYEKSRPPRRSNIEMILPRDLRQRMLRKEWDVTQSQIASAVRANIKAKNQRRTTVQNLGKSTKMEEAMENASKGVSGLFGRSTDKKVKKLEEQARKAEQARKQRQLNGQMADEPETTAPMEEVDNGDQSDAGSSVTAEESKRAIVAQEE